MRRNHCDLRLWLLSTVVTSPRGRGAKYCHQRFSMSVCLSARKSRKPHDQTSPNFCTRFLWLWLGPLLTTMQYVMHFRLCGWRHVFYIMGHASHLRLCQAVWRHCNQHVCIVSLCESLCLSVSLFVFPHHGIAHGGEVCCPRLLYGTMIIFFSSFRFFDCLFYQYRLFASINSFGSLIIFLSMTNCFVQKNKYS